MIETKKVLVSECKEEKMAGWMELKTMKDERLRAKTMDGRRKLQSRNNTLQWRSWSK